MWGRAGDPNAWFRVGEPLPIATFRGGEHAPNAMTRVRVRLLRAARAGTGGNRAEESEPLGTPAFPNVPACGKARAS